MSRQTWFQRLRLATVLAITAAAVVIAVLNLRDRLNASPIPHDGIEWVETAEGIKARSVSPDSPLAFVLRPGDYIRGIKYLGKYEYVTSLANIDLYLERVGVGNEGLYLIERHDPVLQDIYGISQGLYDAEFVIAALPQNLERGLYLAFVGLVYLGIGLFVLFKQGRAALTYHFFAWSLVSFVVYFYSSTSEFNSFDKLVSVIDASSLALLAPLFLHFCSNFPSGKGWPTRRPALAWLLYLPAAILVTFEVIWHYAPSLVYGWSLLSFRNLLNTVAISQYALFFVGGSAMLVATFVRARTPLLRQQLKWIIWGLGLSVLPFVSLYFVPFVSGVRVTPMMEAVAYGPLILIPLSFGYSIIRYRLMDVDVIMRRSFVHVMATVAVGALYMAVLLGVSDLVKFIWVTADLNSYGTKVIVVIGMLVVAMLFAPIKNRLQIWADRWFYGERYSLRMGLQDFGKTLAQTTALPHLLDSLMRRLSDMLSVRQVAIFIEDESGESGFRLVRASQFDADPALPVDARTVLRVRSVGRGFVTAEDFRRHREPWEDTRPGAGEAGIVSNDQTNAAALYYFVPCVVRDRMVAVIGVGRTDSGALLTSEDTDLLKALSGYVAVAIENSLLYRSEKEKADELARLKEFSENIIESVNVGILVVDFDGRITTWNSALEEMFGLARDRALRRDVGTVLDPDLVETFQNVIGSEDWSVLDPRHIYKYHCQTEDGRPLILNISLAPFESAPGVATGTLVVIENVTERIQLEQQLLQREKLSSIGLLAAGVAHEVNTPLAGISSYSQMLLQQIPEGDPRRRLLDKIHSQTVRASGIVNNLLNFSRTGDPQFRDIDVNQVLDDTLQLLEPQLRNTRVEIVRHYSPDLQKMHANASKLQQVFMNLVLNARDAMSEGGRLTIQTRQVDSSLVIDFRDTGTGIAPENIARIYDPFFTTKEVGEGTGLGLALSYGIIQEHGGRIFVESRPGEGAHFTIKLPISYSRQIQAASD